MENNQQERILEQYIEEREKEENIKEDKANKDLNGKRSYIKKHIMNEYEGNEEILELFAEYFLTQVQKLKGIKTQDHNLDLINLPELTQIVENFKKQHPRKKIKPELPEEESIEHLLKEEIIDESHNLDQKLEVWNVKKVYYSNGAWDYELSGYEECKKQKSFFQTTYNPKNIVIVFSNNFTKKTGGFFGILGTLELWIQIKSNIFKQSVERTINDFIFLRKALKRLFPFTFIPPLSIEEKDLGRIQQESVRVGLMNECRKFINAICKNQQLLQSFYTFRFFTEQKYSNYVEHKKKCDETLINHVKLLKNINGCVPIQLSDSNESVKKDYSKKSQHIQKLWRNLQSSNIKIVNKLQQIEQQISAQQRQFSTFLTELTTTNQNLHVECYQKLTQILFCYSDFTKVFKENMNQYKKFYQSVNLQHAHQAQINWKSFITYKGEVGEYSNEYQARRKVFIEKQINEKAEKTTRSLINGDDKKKQPKQNPNMSVIIELGFDTNDEREVAWIERYSKWQAYINKQFTLSFQKLVEGDREILAKLMQDRARNVLELNKREEQLFISYLSILHQ